ncbi:uncharacterized protein BDZ99DRAFT_461691 [Mytilinidion resinicola]|uniref:SMP domain-containing protein n=1 Tax=Mytilinidion resinicola TaxID=574789 RepID=A0A6A6YUR2_9PEZI|nr:uncharacterized protein BDZ99DRAFT_461691 [Mytilinidion resinicola]KAF2811687.1 hypothetical protein BDZ99DRAFT_461691 [Mytilinidion resinicola]
MSPLGNDGKGNAGGGEKTAMTKGDSARIQSAQAKSGNDLGFARRAQSAADKSANQAAGQGTKK